jgi:hypothetical protein
MVSTVTRTMKLLQFLGRTSNGNERTVYVFERGVNENEVTVSIFYLVSKGNHVIVTFCGKDAHLW